MYCILYIGAVSYAHSSQVWYLPGVAERFGIGENDLTLMTGEF
jgi:hypothetical protein